jgi:hypothetical protein
MPVPINRAFSTIGRVTPCSVKSPSIVAVVLPVRITLVDVNVAVGYLAVSNHWLLFNAVVSAGTVVITDVIPIVTSSLSAAGLAVFSTKAARGIGEHAGKLGEPAMGQGEDHLGMIGGDLVRARLDRCRVFRGDLRERGRRPSDQRRYGKSSK